MIILEQQARRDRGAEDQREVVRGREVCEELCEGGPRKGVEKEMCWRYVREVGEEERGDIAGGSAGIWFGQADAVNGVCFQKAADTFR